MFMTETFRHSITLKKNYFYAKSVVTIQKGTQGKDYLVSIPWSKTIRDESISAGMKYLRDIVKAKFLAQGTGTFPSVIGKNASY